METYCESCGGPGAHGQDGCFYCDRTGLTPSNLRVVNLTPHMVSVIDQMGRSVDFQPSGQVARCTTRSVMVGTLGTMTLWSSVFGAVTGLPEPVGGTFYLVSQVVRLALPERQDLVSPGEIVRDADGKPVGCKGLNANL